MVKVLMINYEYPPLGGGTAVANYYLLKEFKKFNFKVDLLTSSADEYKVEKFSSRINVFRLDIGKNNLRPHHQSYLDLIRFFWHSTSWILNHKNQYGLIHAYSGIPGSISAWLSGKPYIISFRGADEPGYEPRHDFFWKLIKPLMAYAYQRARALDANSRYLKQLVLKSFPGLKIQVINNGVDTTNFYPAKKPVKQPIILCTSRLGKRKGVEYLIHALAQVPRTQLWLAGSGQLEPVMKRLTAKLHLSHRVKFLGRVPHDRLPAIYRRARLFVLPSLSESQSNSLLEALASGLPAVATNVGGNPEVINPQNGLLVPPADSQALVKAIAIALIRSWPTVKLEQKFSWENPAKQYWRLYSQLPV